MPLRILLTGKLHGPEMGDSILLLHRAGTSGIVAPEAEFVTLDERFKVVRSQVGNPLTRQGRPWL